VPSPAPALGHSRVNVGPVTEELPLGAKLDWTPVERPPRAPLRGEHIVLRPVDAAADVEALYAASHPPQCGPAMWTYLPYGPFEGPGEMAAYLAWAERSEDPLFFALVPLPGELPAGIASYLRIEPEFGVVEIGHIWFGAPLRRTTAATEAIYLLGRHAFDELGYRRLEWKCNALNAASRRAAERFGFRLEGVFRNHMVVKGRNRDSAWYAITAEEWPVVRRAYEEWLAPENLETDLRQKRSLRDFLP
jgi:RimJ/RimL family protein N-acetyltransferase